MDERNVEKHEITQKEIDFLIALQKEMNTQDTVCQAAPRFWMIEQKEKKVVPAGYEDGRELYDNHGAESIGDLEDAVEYFANEYDCIEIEPYITGSYTIRKKNDDYHPGQLKMFKYEAESKILSLEDLLQFLECWDVVEEGRYSICYYRDEETLCKDTLFLTNKACKEHLDKYGYNYHAGAHSFAMTAHRSPEVEKLWRIIETVDWEKFKK